MQNFSNHKILLVGNEGYPQRTFSMNVFKNVKLFYFILSIDIWSSFISIHTSFLHFKRIMRFCRKEKCKDVCLLNRSTWKDKMERYGCFNIFWYCIEVVSPEILYKKEIYPLMIASFVSVNLWDVKYCTNLLNNISINLSKSYRCIRTNNLSILAKRKI